MANWTFGEKEKKRYGEILSSAAKNIYDQQQEQQQATARAAEKDTDIRAQHPVTQVYDRNVDYMARAQEAADKGDLVSAAKWLDFRDSKITGEGLDTSLYYNPYSEYLPRNRYVYDPKKSEAYTAAKAQQDAIFEKIMNRGDYQRDPSVDAAYQAYLNQAPFSYNAEEDPLYQQYRDQYTTLGKNAMRDTMGQAAALTGGYGSTYAQQAGQQSYDAYLGRLNDMLPELYGAAYNRYRDERSDLAQRYSMAQAMDEAAYNRYLNEQNMDLQRYNMAAGQATDAYNQGYNAWSTRLGLEREDEANAYSRRLAEEQMAYQQQQQAYSDLVSLIAGTGYTPTDAELAAAGMTRARADALKAEYEYQKSLAAASFSSGGGSGRSSGGSGRGRSYSNNNVTLDYSTEKSEPTAAEVAAQRKQQITTNLEYMKRYGATKDQMVAEIERYIAEYGLDDAFAAELMRKYVNTATAAKGSGGGKGGTGSGRSNVNLKGEY